MKRSFSKLGHKPKGVMNKTEALYAGILETKKSMGAIKEYGFEKLKFNIGQKCWYTPDFMVIENNDQLTMIEVKGWITDDGMVKFKAVCTLYPFIKFIMVKYENKQWKVIREN